MAAVANLVHHPRGGEPTTLATTVDVARGYLEQTRGLMFRRSIPDDYALVFEFSRPGRRSVHMLFVPFPLDVLWLEEDRVRQVRRLPAWTGTGRGRADRLVELPAGAAAAVSPGDTVRLVGPSDRRTG